MRMAIVWRDLVLLMLLGLVAAVILLISWVNPVAKPVKSTPAGTMSFQIYWPDQRNIDVDMWVRAPGQRPVGYSNKGGPYLNLLRDDLGFLNDVTGRNFEFAYSRGIPDGVWVVNVHLFRFWKGEDMAPVPVHVLVTKNVDGEKVILEKKVVLQTEGEELTVWRFTMHDGKLVAGSVKDFPTPLRAAQ